jgi:hypothetical protein
VELHVNSSRVFASDPVLQLNLYEQINFGTIVSRKPTNYGCFWVISSTHDMVNQSCHTPDGIQSHCPPKCLEQILYTIDAKRALY